MRIFGETPVEPGMQELRARVHTGDIPAGLDELAGLPAASFFQRADWLRAVARAAPRYRPFVVGVEDSRGALQAAVPCLAVTRLGLTRLYAGAWGTYGGVLARTPEAAAAAAAALDRIAGSRRIALVRVHDFAGSVVAAGVEADAWRRRPEACQVLDLADDPDPLFHDAFTPQNRNKIRKAEKLGVQVRRANDAPALALYARLYRESARRWGVRRRLDSRFFAALAGVEGVDVWLAERDGEAVAALLNLRGGGQIMNWGNVSRSEAWELAPNNLLHWRAIAAACTDRSGPRLYNFGGSAGLPGVHAFKAAFGARTHTYERLERVAPWAAWAKRIF